jgi:hypothetical protein
LRQKQIEGFVSFPANKKGKWEINVANTLKLKEKINGNELSLQEIIKAVSIKSCVSQTSPSHFNGWYQIRVDVRSKTKDALLQSFSANSQFVVTSESKVQLP